MTTIQAILFVLSLLAAIFASFIFRSRLAYRLLAACFFLVGSSFVVFPDATTVIAHRLGVGRGADLLLYVSIFAGIHAFLLLYSRMRRLERMLTQQIRWMAIRTAQDVADTSTFNLDETRLFTKAVTD